MTSPVLSGLLSGLSLIVAIGAQNAFVLRQGILREHLLPLALICSLSDAVLIMAGISGLGALVERSPFLLDVTRYGGAAFLFAYAVHAARRAWLGETLILSESERMSLRAAVLTCLGFTFLNPHVYLDTVVLLGALANQQGPHGRWLFGAGATTASLLWFFTLAYGARILAPVFRRPGAWRVLDGLIAVTMALLATALLQSGSLQ